MSNPVYVAIDTPLLDEALELEVRHLVPIEPEARDLDGQGEEHRLPQSFRAGAWDPHHLRRS